MTRVLNCGVDDELRRLRALILETWGCTVVSAKTAGDAIREMNSRQFDVLLLCYQLGIDAGKQVSDEFRRRFPGGKLVVIENVPTDPNVLGANVVVSAYHPADMVSAVTGDSAKVRPAKAAA